MNGCAGTGCVQRQETWDYNTRMQPVRVQLGTSSNPNAHSCLVYNWYAWVASPTSCAVAAQGTGNNGLLWSYLYQDTGNASLSHTGSFGYDYTKRLANSVAMPSGSGTASHNLTFAYDRYGNMACVTNGQTNGPCPNWRFDTSTNCISTSGFGYDAAGNLTQDGTGTGTHTSSPVVSDEWPVASGE